MTPGVMIAAMIGAFLLSLATQAVALRINVAAGLMLFMLYATLIGVMIAPIWIVYKQATIGAAFALTGGTFVAMSFVGMITKMDLSKLHSILIMGAIGLFIASITNVFIASNALSWMVTYAVVIIFTGLIATQTQQLKEFAIANGENGVMAGRMAVVGALVLYIAFINLFLAILRILGDRK
jgi:FtsH-binding integral membrane protein